MSEGPAYLRSLESQLTLSNIGFGTMFTTQTAAAPTATAATSLVNAPLAPPVPEQKKLKFLVEVFCK